MKTIVAKNLTRVFQMGETTVTALKNVSVEVEAGELIAITGQSGSGKSTLMNLLGCLDTPTSGDYEIDGENVAHMTHDELAKVRNQKIGFVFQKFHLLPDLTALDNVALPALYAGEREEQARQNAKKALTIVELEHRLDHFPYQLSGGQQQRVAIARALINGPSILLADEPTGNLDTETGNAIINLFKQLNEVKKVTIIMVTHEPDIAQHAKRTITLRDGIIVSDGR
jgi:putative ABC transport system ATP-binding protein